MRLVEELREQGIHLEAIGDRLKFRGPAKLLTPTLRQQIAEHKAEILTHLHQQLAGTLESRARYARTEPELERLVEEIQSSFEQGQLTQMEAERLTYLSIEIARQLEAGLTAVVETERVDSPFYEPAVAQQQALRHLLVVLLADEEQTEKKPL